MTPRPCWAPDPDRRRHRRGGPDCGCPGGHRGHANPAPHRSSTRPAALGCQRHAEVGAPVRQCRPADHVPDPNPPSGHVTQPDGNPDRSHDQLGHQPGGCRDRPSAPPCRFGPMDRDAKDRDPARPHRDPVTRPPAWHRHGHGCPGPAPRNALSNPRTLIPHRVPRRPREKSPAHWNQHRCDRRPMDRAPATHPARSHEKRSHPSQPGMGAGHPHPGAPDRSATNRCHPLAAQSWTQTRRNHRHHEHAGIPLQRGHHRQMRQNQCGCAPPHRGARRHDRPVPLIRACSNRTCS